MVNVVPPCFGTVKGHEEEFLEVLQCCGYWPVGDLAVFLRVDGSFPGFTVDLEEKETLPEIINESGNGLTNQRMSIGMARTNEPHSASSQFYINLADNFSLDPMPTRWGYAVFGDVIQGFNVVNAIAGNATQTMNGMQDVPVAPVIILDIKRID